MAEKQMAVRNEGAITALPSANAQNAGVVALITKGDLNGLSNEQVMQVYIARCDALGVDARTQPFDIITFQGKKVLYPNARLADQLISQYGLSVEKTKEETTPEGIRVVEVRVTNGVRTVVASAALSIKGVQGQDLANAWMKCETKATRRGVLRFCGLGAMPEQPEVDPTAFIRERIDIETGEILRDDDADADEQYRQHGLKRLHAAGKQAGVDHETLRALAQKQYPDITSLAELGGAELEALADVVMQLADDATVEAELIAVTDAEPDASPIGEYVARIGKAGSRDELHAIAAELHANGIADVRLGEAFTARHKELMPAVYGNETAGGK